MKRQALIRTRLDRWLSVIDLLLEPPEDLMATDEVCAIHETKAAELAKGIRS